MLSRISLSGGLCTDEMSNTSAVPGDGSAAMRRESVQVLPEPLGPRRRRAHSDRIPAIKETGVATGYEDGLEMPFRCTG
jgi:hypothetical protein